MFKKIINKVKGRKKVLDESMDFSAVQKLLEKLNGVTKIDIHYTSYSTHATFRDATPTDVLEFVRKEFEPHSTKYCKANHQVFSGKQDERHYVDLRTGHIEASVGTQEFRNRPYTKATLEYVIGKKE